jgi:hypothetical protein
MNMKRKDALLFIVAALAGVLFWHFSGSAPKDQPSLTLLTTDNLDQFKHEFNQAADRTRLVLLFSPT